MADRGRAAMHIQPLHRNAGPASTIQYLNRECLVRLPQAGVQQCALQGCGVGPIENIIISTVVRKYFDKSYCAPQHVRRQSVNMQFSPILAAGAQLICKLRVSLE